MTEQLAFRKAELADADVLSTLYSGLDPKGQAPAPARIRALLQRLSSYPDYHVWMVSSEGRPVGTYGLLIMETIGARCAPAAVVEDVVVAGPARGSGIGRAMMEHAMEQARNAGCYKLVLSSNVRRDEAHRFYEALGFRRHGYSFVVELLDPI